MLKLAENIQRLCEDNNWSLAKLSKEAGVPKTTLHAWTTGRDTINLKQLKKVALKLKISVHELLYGELDPFEPKSETILKELFSGDIRVTLHKIEKQKGS